MLVENQLSYIQQNQSINNKRRNTFKIEIKENKSKINKYIGRSPNININTLKSIQVPNKQLIDSKRLHTLEDRMLNYTQLQIDIKNIKTPNQLRMSIMPKIIEDLTNRKKKFNKAFRKNLSYQLNKKITKELKQLSQIKKEDSQPIHSQQLTEKRQNDRSIKHMQRIWKLRKAFNDKHKLNCQNFIQKCQNISNQSIDIALQIFKPISNFVTPKIHKNHIYQQIINRKQSQKRQLECEGANLINIRNKNSKSNQLPLYRMNYYQKQRKVSQCKIYKQLQILSPWNVDQY